MKKKYVLIAGIGAAVITAITLLIRKNRVGNGERPSKKAPQLPIQNPGDQSEFISSPSESELG
jgi:hypothetical protein